MLTKNALVLRDYLTKTKEEIVSSFIFSILTSQNNSKEASYQILSVFWIFLILKL